MNVIAATQRADLRPSHHVNAHLTFAKARDRTVLVGQKTPHPSHITRPFHYLGDPKDMATLYLQSSSGGLYGDDDLELRLTVGKSASAHVTTQASTIVHAARGGQTHQSVHLALAENSYLEYLPDPAILFSGAHLRSEVIAELHEGAQLILCDSALAHDPEGQGAFFERFANTLKISGKDGTPILLDRSDVTGEAWARRTAPLTVHGLMIVAGAIDAQAVADAITESLPAEDSKIYGAVSPLPERNLCTCRVLAADGASFTRAIEAVWSAARLALTGKRPEIRRK
ncbi:MAG: urease accessory protein UreD [Pseudomonadota bacterium]